MVRATPAQTRFHDDVDLRPRGPSRHAKEHTEVWVGMTTAPVAFDPTPNHLRRLFQLCNRRLRAALFNAS